MKQPLKEMLKRIGGNRLLTEKTGGHNTYKALMKLEKGIRDLEKNFRRDPFFEANQKFSSKWVRLRSALWSE